MPAFIRNGPDIPEFLLQAHEEGKVIFFCGAGISVPAGLPLFKGLVDEIYEELGTTKYPVEESAYKNEQYDVTLNQLERRFPGGRSKVRSTLTTILEPKWRRKNALTTHQALLELSKNRKGTVRIVTTNFDRIFQRVIAKEKLDIPSLAAPFLPIPKSSRWHGVIYLHGLLPNTNSLDDVALNRLVLSSGDFGLAYLTERWASRFVSDLFRNYIVCFVGYGINDPVMRYMMDALAADEMLGEKAPDSYAFVSFQNGEEQEKLNEWKAKGVIPLLYEVPVGTKDHSALYKTLKEWADIYRDGVTGKEMIVTQHASTPPLSSSRSDFAVGRVLWALTSEFAAKRFADLNPAPSLKWLEPLSENQFGYDDLSRFGVPHDSTKNNELNFSFLHRPAPYFHAPYMSIVDRGRHRSNWDKVMMHLARWLTRHLNDPQLVLWIVRHGGQLHEAFIRLIRDRMDYIMKLEIEKKQDELDSIVSNSPQAIPCEPMRVIWEIILAGRAKSHSGDQDMYQWIKRAKQGKITLSMRMELRNLLSPCVIFRAPIRLEANAHALSQPQKVIDFVDWGLELTSSFLHTHFYKEIDNKKWQVALPDLLPDFNILLQDALNLMHNLGEADDEYDLSGLHQPSISPHAQNRGFRDWTVLIDLTRDAWLATAQINPRRAHNVAEDWFHSDYLLLKRLAFFAATHSDVVAPQEALDWLLSDGNKCMWSHFAKREVIRLLVSLSEKLDNSQISKLENAILTGPPRANYKTNIKQREWTEIKNRGVWLRLAKIAEAEAPLSEAARNELGKIEKKHPKWKLAEDERDEFSIWMESSRGGDNEQQIFLPTPRALDELVAWLEKYSDSDYPPGNDWHQRCRSDLEVVASALHALTQKGVWQTGRWRVALIVWAEDDLSEKSWYRVSSILVEAPPQFLLSLSGEIGLWIRSVSKKIENSEAIFLSFCSRMFDLEYENGSDTDEPLNQAINHPVGRIVEALLDQWYRKDLKDNQGLPQPLVTIFTKLCDTQIKKFRHGRTLLAQHVIALYRIDPEWTTTYLVPLFDWQYLPIIEARSVWDGFLWSPSLYPPFLSVIKKSFLETAKHYEYLGESASRYVDFLTFVALLKPGDIFDYEELSIATKSLPEEGLVTAAQTLDRALAGAQEKRREYWQNRLLPYLRKVWPQFIDKKTSKISDELAKICITAGEMFPCVLQELEHWLEPVKYTGYLIMNLHQEGLCQKFPEDALKFLKIIVDDSSYISAREIGKCLNDIEEANQDLTKNEDYIFLHNLCRTNE